MTEILAPPRLSPILGLDPGSRHTGYGLIETQNGQIKVLSYGRLSPQPDWSFPKRLAYIHRGLREIVLSFKPVACAIEGVFTFKNPASAIKLAQARGVAVLAASLDDIAVFEYTPNQIKSAVTGQGKAEKTQVAFMVKKILCLNEDLPLDTTDALAVAICHSGQKVLSSPKAAKTGKAWARLSPEDLTALGFKISEKY
jgi:crossover junction endodeoxyribonuclease RuvC